MRVYYKYLYPIICGFVCRGQGTVTKPSLVARQAPPPTGPAMIQRILVPLDGSSEAEGALQHAAALATVFDAEIVLMRVAPVHGEVDDPALSDGVHHRFLLAEALAYLTQVEVRLKYRGLAASNLIDEGDPAERILAASRHRKIDVIVLSRHGHGAHRRPVFTFGTTVQQVMMSAPVSIMIVAGGSVSTAPLETQRYPRIMVPLDGSARAEWALHSAARIAVEHGGELLLAQVVAVPEMARRFPPSTEETRLAKRLLALNRKAAQDYLARITARFEIRQLGVRTHLRVANHVAPALREIADEGDADLVVVTAHGFSGDDEWLYGGVTGSLIAHSSRPLLVLQDLVYTDADDDAEIIAAAVLPSQRASA